MNAEDGIHHVYIANIKTGVVNIILLMSYIATSIRVHAPHMHVSVCIAW